MPEILQERLPVAPWMAEHTLRLPGTAPIRLEDWLQRAEAFAGQMAYRDRLIAGRPDAVHAMTEDCRAAAEELLDAVLERLRDAEGYTRGVEAVRRPDGVDVPLDRVRPLLTAGRLVQEDLLVLEKSGGAAEHALTGGILCFPSNWTLAEKMERGLERIHLPVEVYDAGIARRVQRMFDALRPDAPLMRANVLSYGTHELFNPRHEFDRHRPSPGDDRFVRVERQCLVKLPVTRAVVFSIHTYMVRPSALTPEQRARLDAVRPDVLGGRVAPVNDG
jgi:dimethylamine monooxygenase subunit A